MSSEECQWPNHPNNIKCLERHIPPTTLPTRNQSTDDMDKILGNLIGLCMDSRHSEAAKEEAKADLHRMIVESKIEELEKLWKMGVEHGVDNRIEELTKELEEEV